MTEAVRLWARNEVDSRWRTLVTLGLMAGLVSGLALAAVAGARRTETAYQRFRSATGRSDAIVFATQLGVFDADYAPVRRLPEVADAGEFTLTAIGIKAKPEIGTLPPGDDRLYRSVNRPLLVAGRLPDPRKPDEVLVNRAAATEFHLGVGDRVTVVSSLVPFSGSLEDGPSVGATVVGVGDSNMDLVFQGDDPAFVPSAAFLADHPELARAGNLVVRLRPGTDVSTFRQHVADVMGLPDIPVRDQAEDTKRITHGTDVERTALLLFAGTVVLAGMVLVGQALARTVYAVAEASPPLRALGFTRSDLVLGLLLPLSISATVAAAASLVTAIALSPRFPLGLAGRLEPDRGVHLDWSVLGPGASLVLAAVLMGAGLAALRSTAGSGHHVPRSSGFPLVRALARVVPLPAVIGAGLALERGEGKRALPVRPALASATAAILGVVGAFGLLYGIDDALRSPSRAGQVWDVEIFPDDSHPISQIEASLKDSSDVVAVAAQRRINLESDGHALPVYAFDALVANQSLSMLRGVPPAGPHDVVIGPATAKALRRAVGDTIAFGGPDGPEARVVGIGLLPQTPHSSFDQGAWMTSDGLRGVVRDDISPLDTTVVARFAPGVDPDAGAARINDRLGGNADIEAPGLPQDVTYLRNVRSLPKALAAFLVLLGLGALAHVLVAAVRRRRHDLAVLRAIGFRPWQVASCVAWQSMTVSMVALVLGIPLGIAVGRWSWRWVADATPLLYVAPVAVTAIVLAIPAALVLANVTAAIPARRAARLRPADVLRAE